MNERVGMKPAHVGSKSGSKQDFLHLLRMWSDVV